MSYEFSTSENKIIRRTGKYAKLWGMMTLGGGVLIGLLGISAALTRESFDAIAAVVYVLLALIPILVGRDFVRAGNALSAVVTTEGNDIDHLMVSMSGLGKAFVIQTAAVAVWAAVMLVAIALSIAAPSVGG